MICGYFEDIGRIKMLPETAQKALLELKSNDLTLLIPDTYTLSNGTRYKVVEYETKTGRRFASHETYADLSIMLSGREVLTIGDKNTATALDYDAEKDVRHYSGIGVDYVIEEGMFAFIPIGEIHRTKQAVDGIPMLARSILIKIYDS